jgi:signal transduction histidine kinase
VKAAKKISDAETLRIAGQTLHDDVAPLLTGAGFQLQLLRMDHPETAAQVNEVLSVLDDAMERVRRLSQQLAPSPFTPAGSEE